MGAYTDRAPRSFDKSELGIAALFTGAGEVSSNVLVARLLKFVPALTPARHLAASAALACWFVAGRAATQDSATQNPPSAAAPFPGDEDTDGDGIPDHADACKRVKGVASDIPHLNGCPPPVDTDGDGIADTDDACPKKKGDPSSDPKLNGCPTPATRAKKTIAVAPIRAARTVRLESAKPGGPVLVTFAGFHSFDDGRSLVFVELSGPVSVDVRKIPSAVVYTLENAKVVVHNNQNPLVTNDFPSIVRRATIKQQKKAVELTIALKADAEPTQTVLERDGSTVLEIRLPPAPPGLLQMPDAEPGAQGTGDAPATHPARNAEPQRSHHSHRH
jgi:Thrombospondin type 3 repeat